MSTPATAAASAIAGRRRRPAPPAPRHAAPAPTTGARARAAGSRAAAAAATHVRRSVREGARAPRFEIPGKGGDAHRLVVAEFVACVILIGASPILIRKPDTQNRLYLPNDFVRLTAVSVLFFVLALSSNSPRSARVAAAFGALVTLGVFYNTRQTWAAIGAVFTHQQQQAPQGGPEGAPAGTASVTLPSYNPITNLGQGDPNAAAAPAPGPATAPQGPVNA